MTDVPKVMRLNDLWRPVYPYLGKWVGQWCTSKNGRFLEMGPFSGGISNALAEQFPSLKSVCVMPQSKVAREIKKDFIIKER